jgi:CCR4-NOT transcription complex subunit 1
MESVFAEPLNTEDALDRYQQVAHKIEAMIANDGKDADIQCVIAEVPDILHRCVSRDEAALAIAEKVFRNLYENASKGTSVTWILATLVAICDVCKLVVKEITSWVMYSDEEKKFNVDIITGLIRSEILNLGDYDVHIAKIIDSGRNKGATEFAISLVQTLITQKPNGVSKLYNVVDALSKLAIRPGSPESLQQLIEIATTNFNNAASFAVMKDEKVLSGHALMYKEEDDTALADAVSFQDQVAVLFSDWCHIYDHPTMGDSAYSHYIAQLQQHGLLKGDDLTDRFFHILTELAVAHTVVSEQVTAPGGIPQQPAQQLQISYFSVDSYSKLVTFVVKYCVDLAPNKGSLLSKILFVTARTIQKDAEEKKVSFNPRPYFRLFINLLSELSTADLHDAATFQVLTAFANAFHVLQPLRVPAWRFAISFESSCNL